MLKLSTIVRLVYVLVFSLTLLALCGIVLLLVSKSIILGAAERRIATETTKPFPVSVNVHTKTIAENVTVNQFYHNTLAIDPRSTDHWWNKVAAAFSDKHWYQNLASPVSRIAVIWPGERKEEVSKHMSDILHWGKAEREEFMRLMDTSAPILSEGKYFPGQYVTHKGATTLDMYTLVSNSFQTTILNHYTTEVRNQVPLEDALIIASLIEREASDFDNMREVSGVIWNRLFNNMPLQLDATLQYVKGSSPYQSVWWPLVQPADKYLESPFNTYKYDGLPPAPIANPSAEAILAALNPVITDCLFYFHDKKNYYCSPTYEEHVSKLRSLYGRGS